MLLLHLLEIHYCHQSHQPVRHPVLVLLHQEDYHHPRIDRIGIVVKRQLKSWVEPKKATKHTKKIENTKEEGLLIN